METIKKEPEKKTAKKQQTKKKETKKKETKAKKPEPEKEYNYKVKTSGSRLRVRSKSSLDKDSLIITTLANGTEIHVVKFCGKMAQIDKPTEGYVSKTYIDKI